MSPLLADKARSLCACSSSSSRTSCRPPPSKTRRMDRLRTAHMLSTRSAQRRFLAFAALPAGASIVNLAHGARGAERLVEGHLGTADQAHLAQSTSDHGGVRGRELELLPIAELLFEPGGGVLQGLPDRRQPGRSGTRRTSRARRSAASRRSGQGTGHSCPGSVRAACRPEACGRSRSPARRPAAAARAGKACGCAGELRPDVVAVAGHAVLLGQLLMERGLEAALR